MTGAVYRFFASDGTLLYVGRSMTALARLAQHEVGAPWFNEAATITIEYHADAPEAERRAILSERPRHNRALNPDDERKRSVIAITDALGAEAISAKLSVTAHSIRHARTSGSFPASWYAPLDEMCDAANVECPRDAFNWKAAAEAAE